MRTKGEENREPVGSGIVSTDLQRRFLTLSNVLSLFRLLLPVPFVLVMKDGSPEGRLWGAVLMLVAAATDKLDGVVARRLHQTSEWGKVLDPLADKVAVGAVVVVLYVLGDLPAWFLVIALGRDLLILCGGLYLRSRTAIIVPSNEFGKWTVGIVSLALFVLVLSGRTLIADFLLWGSTAMLLVSLGLYGKRFDQLLKSTSE
jgi:CDP-diacylglycerol--glycerol-3-phosphate 3-phosphatidyltransferase